jgi:hypothetical protein
VFAAGCGGDGDEESADPCDHLPRVVDALATVDVLGPGATDRQIEDFVEAELAPTLGEAAASLPGPDPPPGGEVFTKDFERFSGQVSSNPSLLGSRQGLKEASTMRKRTEAYISLAC